MQIDESNDGLEEAVRSLYEAYPYPAANAGAETLPELGALLRLFFLENKVGRDNAHLLDIGTGSGNRLLGAAQMIPALRCTGVDFSATSIRLARESSARLGFDDRSPPVEFAVADILNDSSIATLGNEWPFISCMGVLHHIPRRSRALRNLHGLLAPDGYLFLYVYGEYGSRDRILCKELIGLLTIDPGDREDRLKVAKAIGAEIAGYGWQIGTLTTPDRSVAADAATEDISIVDALLHDYETTFTADDLVSELSAAGFEWFAPIGITAGDRAYLIKSEWRAAVGAAAQGPYAESPSITASAFLLERFNRLGALEKLQVVERIYKPNGYTVVAGISKDSAACLGRRLRANRVDLTHT